jgi:hypothetical protein
MKCHSHHLLSILCKKDVWDLESIERDGWEVKNIERKRLRVWC